MNTTTDNHIEEVLGELDAINSMRANCDAREEELKAELTVEDLLNGLKARGFTKTGMWGQFKQVWQHTDGNAIVVPERPNLMRWKRRRSEIVDRLLEYPRIDTQQEISNDMD